MAQPPESHNYRNERITNARQRQASHEPSVWEVCYTLLHIHGQDIQLEAISRCCMASEIQ